MTNEPKENPSIVLIPTDRDNLLAFEYRGHVRSEDLDVALGPLKERMDRNDHIDLFVRMDHFSGFDPAIVFKSSLLSMKMAALKKLRRYAIVGAGDWIGGIVKMFDPLVGIEMKTFDLDQEEQAWAWVNQADGTIQKDST
ncbi:MAG: STAS/SEC14 domain-containing protein [Rubripirellula sp.]